MRREWRGSLFHSEEVNTYLLVKVCFGELQWVEQRVGGGQFDIVAGLLLPHALDDGRQDLVGVFLQLFWVLTEEENHHTGGKCSYILKTLKSKHNRRNLTLYLPGTFLTLEQQCPQPTPAAFPLSPAIPGSTRWSTAFASCEEIPLEDWTVVYRNVLRLCSFTWSF